MVMKIKYILEFIRAILILFGVSAIFEIILWVIKLCAS